MLCCAFERSNTTTGYICCGQEYFLRQLLEFWLASLLCQFRWPVFRNRKYLHLGGIPSEMQHDFSLGTVNISGWHRVRKIQKCIFLAFWVILSEMHSNGYKKCWCKLQNFVKENQVVLKLDHNPIILSWKNTAKEWVSLLLSHQSVMRKYLHMWKEARTVDRAIQSKGTVFSLLPPSKVHLKKKKYPFLFSYLLHRFWPFVICFSRIFSPTVKDKQQKKRSVTNSV